MADDPNRRSFLRWACHSLSAIFATVLGVPAAMYVIDPRNRPAPPGDFRPVSGVKLSQVADVPVQGVIRDVRRDAWTLHPNDVIGRVWVVRGGEEGFRVWTTTCPHLGCSINCNTEPKILFKCPCHDAEFEVDGRRVDRPDYENPAPRDMDTLEFRIENDPDNPKPNNRDLLLVRYLNFTAGKEAKEVRT